jgi:hypothetical protein
MSVNSSVETIPPCCIGVETIAKPWCVLLLFSDKRNSALDDGYSRTI